MLNRIRHWGVTPTAELEHSEDIPEAEHNKFSIKFIPTVPAAIAIGLVFIAIFANFLSPHDPKRISLADSLEPPAFSGGTRDHLLGTDLFGRDILSRLIHGTRIAVAVSISVLGISTTIGVTLGILAGYLGGKLDSLIMRLVDITLSFPPLLIAIVFGVIYGPSFRNVIIVISLFYWALTARQVRAEALAHRHLDYVILARTAGASHLRIMYKHIFPNVIPTILVITTLQVGTVILFESSLSFLGVGIPPPNPSWGVVVADGREQIASAWWISIFPGLAIMLTVLVMNSLGDWVRDRMDPMLQNL